MTQVGVIMGSDSDYGVMGAAAEALAEFGIAHEVRVVSAHRTPEGMVEYAKAAAGRGLRVIVAGAGGAAHLPGMVAALTPLPVIGVPVPLAHLDGLDSLLSIVQMPAGVPVATVSVGGARNAGLLAVRILAAADPELSARMVAFQEALADTARAKDAALQQRLGTARQELHARDAVDRLAEQVGVAAVPGVLLDQVDVDRAERDGVAAHVAHGVQRQAGDGRVAGG